MKKMKKCVCSVLTAVFVLLSLTTLTSFAEENNGPEVFSEGYCVIDRNTGEIIFQKNMNTQFYPASITKIMTALVTLENCENLDDEVTFSDVAVNSLSADSSTLEPKASVGETMSVRDALYGLMLCSANECGNALAEYTAGSIERFVEMMNQRAEEIGASNTHFVNAHGLHDDQHYTTPYDIAMIFREALKNREFAVIDSTIHYTIEATNQNEARECTMGHQLVSSGEFEGVYAGKTGRTPIAGRTLVTAARRYGIDLIAVVMKSDDEHFYSDTEILLEYAFGMLSGSYPNVEFTEMDDTVYSAGNLNVREFASTYAKSVTHAEEGAPMHRIGTYAGWSKVEFEGGVYFVATDFLRDADGNSIAAPYETAEPTSVAATSERASETSTEEANASADITEPEETPQETIMEAVSAAADDTNILTTQSSIPLQHSYEISEEGLTILILVLVLVIAVVAGILVALLIMRRS